MNVRFAFMVSFILTIFTGCSDKFLTPVRTVPLDADWKFTQQGKDHWLPARMPGSVHTDLVQNQLINDPIHEIREAELQWIAESDWEYAATFDVSDSLLRYRYVDFIFEGLDTYATVTLNDSVLLRADNMFREWRTDGKRYLRTGKNQFKIHLHAPLKRGREAAAALPYRLPGGNEEGTSMFVRKAAYQFGWDWAPKITTSGIWKPIYISAHDGVYITDMQIRTLEIADTSAWLSAELNVHSDADHPNTVITIHDSFRQFRLKPGINTEQVRFRIDHPELWWPNGMGDPKLYQVTARLYVNNYLVDTLVQRTGIRTVELNQDDDEWGKSFYFRVNGLPVFIQGANYVPQSMFLTDVSPDRTRQLIGDVAAVGMNMLRVWGGGIYESDLFYDQCDEKGIMVWQDFMFAGSMYPSDTMFMKNVQAEVRDQVTRLRSHPCIALWCGNNEIEVAWNNWGWQKQYGLNTPDSIEIIAGYRDLFEEKMPQWLTILDGTRPYIPSSPLSNWGKHENFTRGNMHYWGVWHGEEDIDSFRVFIPRFMTEYGMQSYPSFRTLQMATDSARITLESDFLRNRQKSYKGNGLLQRYLAANYVPAGNVEDLCYLSQIHQAEAMRIAVESHRKHARQCMGTLYWQLNDVWDGASWSTLEHNGTCKAAHHALRRLYARDILIAETAHDTTRIFLQTNRVGGITGNIEVKVKDLRGRVLGTYMYEASAGYLVSARVFEQPVSQLLRGAAPDGYFLTAIMYERDGSQFSTRHYFVKPGNLKLMPAAIRREWERSGDETALTLTSDVLAKDVMLVALDGHPVFSDNGFDLLPGEPKRIVVSGKEVIHESMVGIKMLNDLTGLRKTP
jgi:beta-mannosidase